MNEWVLVVGAVVALLAVGWIGNKIGSMGKKDPPANTTKS